MADVSADDRAATVAPALEALEALQSRETSGTLRCPNGSEQLLVIDVQPPADWVHQASPGESFCDVAQGQGRITIRGLSIEGSAIAIEDAPIDFAIKSEGSSTLLDGNARIRLNTRWEGVIILFGLSSNHEFYGDLYFSRSLPSEGSIVSGEDMHCPMSGITRR